MRSPVHREQAEAAWNARHEGQASRVTRQELVGKLRHRASTNTTPVSGSGTVTDSYGGMWNYTYDGTVTTTTTTTTTTHENLPYTDT